MFTDAVFCEPRQLRRALVKLYGKSLRAHFHLDNYVLRHVKNPKGRVKNLKVKMYKRSKNILYPYPDKKYRHHLSYVQYGRRCKKPLKKLDRKNAFFTEVTLMRGATEAEAMGYKKRNRGLFIDMNTFNDKRDIRYLMYAFDPLQVKALEKKSSLYIKNFYYK